MRPTRVFAPLVRTGRRNFSTWGERNLEWITSETKSHLKNHEGTEKIRKKKKRLFKIFYFFCLPFNQHYNLIISVNNKNLLHPRIHKLILEVLSKQKYFPPSAVSRQLVSFATKVGEKASSKLVKDNRSRDISPTKRVLSLLF